MADVDLVIGGRHYNIACRDGGEDHLRALAQHVDRKAQEAASAVGSMNEARQLLFAALLIADECAEARTGVPVASPESAPFTDSDLHQAFDTLAARIEALADALETGAQSA